VWVELILLGPLDDLRHRPAPPLDRIASGWAGLGRQQSTAIGCPFQSPRLADVRSPRRASAPGSGSSTSIICVRGDHQRGCGCGVSWMMGFLQAGELPRNPSRRPGRRAPPMTTSARLDDAGEIVDGFVALGPWRPGAALAARRTQQRAPCLLHVRPANPSAPRKRYRHVIHAPSSGDELGCPSWVRAPETAGAGDTAALAIEALAIGGAPPRLARTRVFDGLVAPNALDVQARSARRTGAGVSPRCHVTRQILVGRRPHSRGSKWPAFWDRAAGVEREGGAPSTSCTGAVAKALDADLGSPEVEQHADALVGALRGPSRTSGQPAACRVPRPCRAKAFEGARPSHTRRRIIFRQHLQGSRWPGPTVATIFGASQHGFRGAHRPHRARSSSDGDRRAAVLPFDETRGMRPPPVEM